MESNPQNNPVTEEKIDNKLTEGEIFQLLIKEDVSWGGHQDIVQNLVNTMLKYFSTQLKRYGNKEELIIISIKDQLNESSNSELSSLINYVFYSGEDCIAALSLSNKNIRSFISLLLKLYTPSEDDSNANNKITDIDKTLLELILSMFKDSLSKSFNINNVTYQEESAKILKLISINPMIFVEIAFDVKSPIPFKLLLNTKVVEQYINLNKGSISIATNIRKALSNLMIQLKFIIGEKAIILRDLNSIKVDDEIFFESKIQVILNNKKIALGDIGHKGNNLAVMITEFCKE